MNMRTETLLRHRWRGGVSAPTGRVETRIEGHDGEKMGRSDGGRVGGVWVGDVVTASSGGLARTVAVASGDRV
jgi:hypothetical protein